MQLKPTVVVMREDRALITPCPWYYSLGRRQFAHDSRHSPPQAPTLLSTPFRWLPAAAAEAAEGTQRWLLPQHPDIPSGVVSQKSIGLLHQRLAKSNVQ